MNAPISRPSCFSSGCSSMPTTVTSSPRSRSDAAVNAMGKGEAVKDVPFFWSQHYDLSFNYVGHATRADDVRLFGSLDETNFAAVYREEGRVTAVVTLFRDDVSLGVELAMERGAGDEEILGIVQRAFT